MKWLVRFAFLVGQATGMIAGFSHHVRAVETVSGVWSSPFGLVVLEQDGNGILGSCFLNDTILAGTMENNRIRFRWRDAVHQSGEGWFDIAPDGTSLTASWSPGGQSAVPGTWTAVRLVEPSDPPGLRVHWRVEMEIADNPALAGRMTGSADLFLDGDVVVGRLAGLFVPADAAALFADPAEREGQENVFSTVSGVLRDHRLRLQLVNVQDGSETEVEAAGSGWHYQGTWHDVSNPPSSPGEPPQRGTITLTREEGGGTDTAAGQARKRHQRLWRVFKAIGESWSSPVNGTPEDAIRAMRERGDIDGAAAALARLADFYRSAKEGRRLVATLFDRAITLELAGRFEEARRAYREILELPGIGPDDRDLAIGGLEGVRLSIGGAAPPERATVPETASRADAPIALKEQARAAERAGRTDEAVALYDKALVADRAERKTLTNAALARARDIDIASILQRVALVEIGRRRWAEAAERLDGALVVWRSLNGGALNAASVGGTLSVVHQRQGRLPAARATIATAIASAEKNNLGETWRLYGQAAQVEMAAGDDGAADAYFRKAVANVETLRGRLVTDETKIAFFGSPLGSPAEVYETYVAFLMDRPGGAQAGLEMAERARARALLDMLASPVDDGGDTVFPGETLSPTVAGPLSVADSLRLAERERTAYLVYFVTARATYVWLVTPAGRLVSGRLDAGNAALGQAVDALREPIVWGENWDAQRLALTRLLSAPVAAELATLPPGTRLTVVPHKVLAEVPFAALGDTPGAWGERWSLSYLPSLSVTRNLSARPLPAEGPMLVVGGLEGDRTLVASTDEVRRVAALFPGATILAGEAATRRRVVAELPKHRLVLLSTHTRTASLPENGQPAELELELAPPESLGARDLKPGMLTGVGLVVLSACETVRGPRFSGDELMNLARAFLIAGAERVLVSQWKVQDEASADIIPAFLGAIKVGAAPAVALGDVTNRYRHGLRQDGTAQPAMTWAPWILVGRHD